MDNSVMIDYIKDMETQKLIETIFLSSDQPY
jgi:hypothetical protein